jgi:hypothetical protein
MDARRGIQVRMQELLIVMPNFPLPKLSVGNVALGVRGPFDALAVVVRHAAERPYFPKWLRFSLTYGPTANPDRRDGQLVEPRSAPVVHRGVGCDMDAELTTVLGRQPIAAMRAPRGAESIIGVDEVVGATKEPVGRKWHKVLTVLYRRV